MTVPPLSRDQLRALDAWAAETLGLPTLVLMENAGRGAADWLHSLAGGSSNVLVLCGPGNNGGDGGVVARRLSIGGHRVRAVWLAPPERLAHDASIQYQVLDRLKIDQAAWTGAPDLARLGTLLGEADWVVDGLLGTGLTRPVEGPLRAVIEAVNRAKRPTMALDLPSGLDADTGRPLGAAIRATVTATFAAPKLGFAAPGASDYTGEVRVFDIGVPAVRPPSRAGAP